MRSKYSDELLDPFVGSPERFAISTCVKPRSSMAFSKFTAKILPPLTNGQAAIFSRYLAVKWVEMDRFPPAPETRSPPRNRWWYSTLLLFVSVGAEVATADPVSPPSVLIREIADLAEGEKIPDWVLKTYDSRTIAENLVFRIHRRYSGQVSEGEKFRFATENFELITFFRSEDAKAIAEHGFQNIHENGKHGLWTPSIPMKQKARMETEGKFARLDFQDISKKQLLPKYGILQIVADADLGYRQTAKNYGDVGAKLKPSVMRRATWTASDSGSLTAREVQTFYAPEQVIETFSPAYLETQVWGALDASDIEYLLIRENSPPGLLDSLKGLGVPIRSYRLEKSNGREQLVALEQLHAGDPSLVKNSGRIEHCKDLISP